MMSKSKISSLGSLYSEHNVFTVTQNTTKGRYNSLRKLSTMQLQNKNVASTLPLFLFSVFVPCNQHFEIITCTLTAYLFSPLQCSHLFCFITQYPPHSAFLIFLPLGADTKHSFSGSEKNWPKWEELFTSARGERYREATWLNPGINGSTWKPQSKWCTQSVTYSGRFRHLKKHFTG